MQIYFSNITNHLDTVRYHDFTMPTIREVYFTAHDKNYNGIETRLKNFKKTDHNKTHDLTTI